MGRKGLAIFTEDKPMSTPHPRYFRQSHHGSSRRLLTLVGLACLVSVLSSGCQIALEYTPQDNLVAELGLDQAQQRLREILLRSVNPAVNAVEVTDEFLRYDLSNTTYQVRVFFKDIKRIDVYTNNVVVVWGAGSPEPVLIRPLLANEQDARTFADLLYSLRLSANRA